MGEDKKAYWLKMQRKKCGLTQKELAKRSGISLRSIQAYEQGSRDLAGASIDLVRRLCQALSCSEDEILTYPGSRGYLFSDWSDDDLRLLYKEEILKEPCEGTKKSLPKLARGELASLLLAEMADRFYQKGR